MILEKTEPQNKNWSIFFNASLDYIEQNWGFDGKTRDQFREEYKKELSIRIAQGQRLLYLSKTDDAYLGFVNAYLEDKGIDNEKTLFIAEFLYIRTTSSTWIWRKNATATFPTA